jgi:DNA-binding phage protein
MNPAGRARPRETAVVLRRVVRTAGRDDNRGDRADLARAFVDEVTWYMSEHKISRADLAQSMGVSAGRVSQILSAEENLTLRTLSGVVEALGAELDVSLHSVDGPAEAAGDDL